VVWFIGRRLVAAVPVLLLSSLVVFSTIHLVPGDPVDAMLGAAGYQGASNRPELVRQVRREMGLDQPLVVQYARWVTGALHGDLGTSYIRRRPVVALIAERLPSTLELTAAGTALAVVFGVSLGVVAALKRHTFVDGQVMTVALLGVSLPNFWLAILLILVFSVLLRWFPATGSGTLRQLVLPATALGVEGAAVIARLTRTALVEVLGRPYITTARAKGLQPRVVHLRHALRNALIPVVTVIGLQIGHLLAGSVVVETIFARQGIGQLAVDAIRAKDYPLVQGIVLFTAVVYVVINLIVDVLYGYLDPQIRLAR